MGNIIRFPLKLRSPEPRPTKTEVVVFPFGHRRHLVERHARAMRAMSDIDAEKYFTRELEKVCAELRTLGIDCDDCECEAIYALAEAVGRALYGEHYQLEREAK
ncbi:hypothetical protein IVB01_12200 [Bradyrhizobium sp. 164]|nr:DUF6074 family protein [Bradyrhizobium sp. 164]MCK1595575.1 hypothetical protein [Bradyrhizobium sp. 164]